MTYSKSNLDANRKYQQEHPRKYDDIPADIKIRMARNGTKRTQEIKRMTEENRRMRV
ncbi:MAG: hypothetical protein PHC39_04835 [Proteiniphilum sp.]|nr:hypothetical protein [Proteiniphilum sp.]